MDLTPFIEKAVTAALSGGASFLGALYQFKKRLDSVEEYVKELKGENKDVPGIRQVIEAMKAGWRLELDSFKLEFTTFKREVEREREHEDELDEMRDKLKSQHDPLEDMKKQLERQEKAIERLKSSGYVKSSEFTEFVRAQEKSWRELERTLGRLGK